MKKEDNQTANNIKVVINNQMKNHADDPFFKKKVEASKKMIEKYGLPKQMFDKK